MATTEPIGKGKKRQSSIPLDSPIAPGTLVGEGSITTPATSLLLAGSTMAKGRDREHYGSEDSTPRNEGLGSSSEFDEEFAADAKLEFKGVWERYKVVKPKRQEWITQRAIAAARDYEMKNDYKFSKEEFNRVVASGVQCLAEQYAKLSRRKISSQGSTPLTGTYMEVADTSKGIQAVEYFQDPGTPHAENKEVRFETETTIGDHAQMSPLRNPTAIAQTIAEPGDDVWSQRFDKMLRREGEIKLFGHSNIPDQGILFDGHVPVDAWKYPKDGERVRAQQAAQDGGTPSSGGSSPPPVPSKDDGLNRPQASGASNSTFIAPTNTAFVTHTRGGTTREEQTRNLGHTPIYHTFRPLPHYATVQPTAASSVSALPQRGRSPPILSHPTVTLARTTTAGQISQGSANTRNHYNQVRPQPRAQSQTRAPSQTRTYQGYEMPVVVNPPDHTIGLRGVAEAREHHRSNMKDRLTRIIDDAIGFELAFPDGYKPSFKADRGDPKKYGGSPKVVDLEDWLSAIVYRLALQRLGGNRPEIDRVRVMLLPDCLEGTAYRWMLRHVMHVNRKVEHWTFQDVIHGLYDRFVHPSSMQDARESLNKVEYSIKDGIQGLYDTMQEHAGGMAVYPDDYSMLSIFLDRIPPYIMTELLNTRGLTPEINSLSEFVANALDIEQRKKNEIYYRDRRTGNASTRAAGGSRANPDKKPVRTVEPRPIEKNTDRFNKNNNNYSKNYGQHRKPFIKTKIQDKTSPRNQTDPKRDQPPPRSGKHKYQWSKEPFKAKEGSNQKQGCYNCDATDHFSKDCPKPRRNKTFVRAARTAQVSGSEDDNNEESLDDLSDRDGSQMPPISEEDEDQRDPDERIEVEVPVGNDYYEDDEHDDRMFGMRTEEEIGYEIEGDFITATVVFPLKGNTQPKEVKMRKHKLIPSRKTRMRPKYSEEEKRCLATWVEINGLRAWTLWDSGSTTTGITPAFAELAKIPVDELEDPHVLQLGTVGSRSSIKYGADVNINIGEEKLPTYVDIANFDRYEMIVGTPFMRQHNVILDFEKGEIIFRGKRIPAITVSTKEIDPTARRQRITDKKNE